MLTENQLSTWFTSNGIDVAVPFPMPLITRLCKKAISTNDKALCNFLQTSFIPHSPDLLVLDFNNWSDGFARYSKCYIS